jgi:GntR family transcriptional regulator
MKSAFRLEPGPVTLYAQLAGILRERIKSGTWPNGAEIPTLEDLAQEFNVARVTVRQAMQILVSDGLVSSQRGRRTFVTYTPAENKSPLFTSIDMVNALTPNYEIAIVSRDEVSDSYLGTPFIGKPRGRYMRIRKVDSESGEPYSASTHFVAMAVYKRFGKVGEDQVKIARLVRDKARNTLASCRDQVTVGAADLEESQALKCPLGAAVARIRRVFIDVKGDVLYYGQLTFRSDRFGIERDITDLVKAG